MSGLAAPNVDRFPLLTGDKAAPWENYAKWDQPFMPLAIGIEFVEVRQNYARMRLPFRIEVAQPQGVMHGGAIATLIDSTMVPAIATFYDERVRMLTLNLDVNYLGAIIDDTAVCEAWVTKRGRSIVYGQAEVRTESNGELCATGSLIYKVSPFA